MSNQIPLRQNEDLQLQRMAAQRRLYSSAKRILSWQMVITVALVVVWSFVERWFPMLKVYAALYGMTAVLLDIAVFTPLQNSLKQKAAGIQELFDCYVLELPWQEIKAGPRPDAELVAEFSRLPSGVNYTSMKLLDWYPAESGTVPLFLGRLICQRANCWWDAKLRRRYSVWILAITCVLSVLVTILGIARHLSLEAFVLADVLPFLPVLVIGFRQVADQRQAATRLDDLKRHSERLWSQALSGEISEQELTRSSRALQDEIFEQRRRTPLIFDWAYNRLRDEHEELMNKCASVLQMEAIAALKEIARKTR